MKNITEGHQNHQSVCKKFYTILSILNREAELGRLVDWATRKRLPDPRKAYQNRLADEERRLFRYTLDHPGLTVWTRRLRWLGSILSPTPRYYPRGSAAKYRSDYLTQIYKKS